MGNVRIPDEDSGSTGPRFDPTILGIVILSVLFVLVLLLLIRPWNVAGGVPGFWHRWRRTEFVEVPPLRGLDEVSAYARIEAAGLRISDVSEVETSSVLPGRVASQNPPTGTKVRWDTGVDIALGLQSDRVEVPSLAGMTAKEASARLRKIGLRPTPYAVYDNFHPIGQVISQVQGPYETLPKGGQVIFMSSMGSRAQGIAVPDFGSMPWAIAAPRAEGLSFNIIRIPRYNKSFKPGGVLYQYPLPGTLAPPFANIVLVTATYDPAAAPRTYDQDLLDTTSF